MKLCIKVGLGTRTCLIHSLECDQDLNMRKTCLVEKLDVESPSSAKCPICLEVDRKAFKSTLARTFVRMHVCGTTAYNNPLKHRRACFYVSARARPAVCTSHYSVRGSDSMASPPSGATGWRDASRCGPQDLLPGTHWNSPKYMTNSGVINWLLKVNATVKPKCPYACIAPDSFTREIAQTVPLFQKRGILNLQYYYHFIRSIRNV